jgi:hypothetical protein
MTQTALIQSTTPVTMPATYRQLEVLTNYGIADFAGTVSEASKEIERIATERAMQDPTPAQRSRLDYLGGKQLAGCGRREISTSITCLTALAVFEQDGDAQKLAQVIRERFKKVVRI